MSLTQAVKNEARRLGFSLAGVTTPDPPPHWPVFEHWLAMGRHARMAYMADRRRSDPRLVLPECQSILVLAVRYAEPGPTVESEGSSPVGCVSAYAWGYDYHLVLPDRLKTLAAFVERQAGRTGTEPLVHRHGSTTGTGAGAAGGAGLDRQEHLSHPPEDRFIFPAGRDPARDRTGT